MSHPPLFNTTESRSKEVISK